MVRLRPAPGHIRDLEDSAKGGRTGRGIYHGHKVIGAGSHVCLAAPVYRHVGGPMGCHRHAPQQQIWARGNLRRP